MNKPPTFVVTPELKTYLYHEVPTGVIFFWQQQLAGNPRPDLGFAYVLYKISSNCAWEPITGNTYVITPNAQVHIKDPVSLQSTSTR